MRIIRNFVLLIILAAAFLKCSKSGVSPTVDPVKPTPTVKNEVAFWLTKSDQSVLLTKQTTVLGFDAVANNYPTILVDDTQVYQTIDGFGYALTGGSAQVINSLDSSVKQKLLQELFGADTTSISVSYLRISIGASDLNNAPFSYDDMPDGQKDLNLSNFSLAADTVDLIPLLKEILAINPAIKIIATPWSAPVWMKDNHSFVGGSLLPDYYSVYSQYFVKYLQTMKALGITITAITPQNEPLNPYNNPSLVMTALEQATFIKANLGPAFQAANLTTKIIVYDHNCDQSIYPLTVLGDAAANPYIDGSAFHLYAGDISALSVVHNAFPDKNVYFTEQYTSSTGDFGGDLNWHLKNVIIGTTINWGKVALEWNLASDAAYEPHTSGGCNSCKGAITINTSNNFTRNVGYYIIAHASKFVPAGSVRIASNSTGNFNSVAFLTPAGKRVLIVENDGTGGAIFNIRYKTKWTSPILDSGSVATFIW